MDKMFDMETRECESIDQWNSIIFHEIKDLLSQAFFPPCFKSQLREKSTLIKEICNCEEFEELEKFSRYVYEYDSGADDGYLEESSEEESSEEESSEEESSEEKSSKEESSEETSEEEIFNVGCCFNRCILI